LVLSSRIVARPLFLRAITRRALGYRLFFTGYEFGLLLGVGGEGRGISGTESPSIPEKLLKVWRNGSSGIRGCIQRKT
jgi:hypothetical protein